MKTTTDRFFNALTNQLNGISAGQGPLIEQYRMSILTCKKAMVKLKNYVSSNDFENPVEEIHFFKVIKPQFYSKYIYYISVYNYIMQKPAGGNDIQQAYIQMYLAEIKTFFDHNRAFYAYYRAGMTQMDGFYYTRGGFDVQVELEDFEEDEQYSTTHDYKLAKLIANERFQDFLNLELAKLGMTPESMVIPFKLMNWTATQTDAVEIIYALKASGAINNGNIDIAEIVTAWEFIFQLDLKDTYHKFTDITKRKKETAIFLTKLSDAVKRWIDDKMGL